MAVISLGAACSGDDARAPRDAAPPPPSPDAEIVETYLDPLRGLPDTSGDTLWGISIPAGCLARASAVDWMRFECSHQLTLMRRYYEGRFPLMALSVKGNGFRAEPGIDGGGYAWIRPQRRGPIQSNLMIFRGGASADDETFQRLRALIPKAPMTGQ